MNLARAYVALFLARWQLRRAHSMREHLRALVALERAERALDQALFGFTAK